MKEFNVWWIQSAFAALLFIVGRWSWVAPWPAWGLLALWIALNGVVAYRETTRPRA